MGTGASRCPADKMMHQKRLEAKKKKHTQSELSKFYCACERGDTDYVREHLTQMSIEDIDKLEGNGDTALHVATRNDHKEIVQLLFNAGCSKTTLNYCAKMPHEEIKTPQMKGIYERPTSMYFHESDFKTSVETFERCDQEDLQSEKFDWINTYENERELKEHSLNQQTAAMWLQFFNWASHRFSGYLNRHDFRADLFELESDRDFDEFLKQAIKDKKAYEKTRVALIKAERSKSIVPLITLYTDEFGEAEDRTPFYKVLNRQLALKSKDDINTAHFCDRFVYEFHMKSDELDRRAYTGKTFRGVSMSDSDVEAYEALTIDGKKGAIATKTFTSTSTNIKRASNFLKAENEKLKPVLFIYNIPTPCSTIFSVADISEYPDEEEILITPGNLFKVCCVVKNSDLTEIHLEHINIKISNFRKLIHTIKATRQRPNVE
jgi:hypothetical protein